MPCCPFAYEIRPARTLCTCPAHPVLLEAALPLSTKVWQGVCLVQGILAWLMTIQRGICRATEMTEHCFLLFLFYMNFLVILLRTVISVCPYRVQTDNCTLHWIQTPNPGSLSSLLGALWEGEEAKAQLLKLGIWSKWLLLQDNSPRSSKSCVTSALDHICVLTIIPPGFHAL